MFLAIKFENSDSEAIHHLPDRNIEKKVLILTIVNHTAIPVAQLLQDR